MPFGNDNPWGQGGAMYNRGPGRTYIRQFSQYGNHFFTPPTPEEIQREAMLQLAVLAVVIAAPVVLPALAGGGAAAGAAAAGTTTMVEGGAVAAGAAAGGGGAAGLAGLQSLVGLGATAAAGLGAAGLNSFLHRSAPVSQSPTTQRVGLDEEPGQIPQQRPPQQDTSQQTRHPSFAMLEALAERISKDGRLRQMLKRIDPCASAMSENAPQPVVEEVMRTLGENRFGNVWESPKSLGQGQSLMPPSEKKKPEYELPSMSDLYRRFYKSFESNFHERIINEIIFLLETRKVIVDASGVETIRDYMPSRQEFMESLFDEGDFFDPIRYHLQPFEIFIDLTEFNKSGEVVSTSSEIFELPVQDQIRHDQQGERGWTYFYATYNELLPPTFLEMNTMPSKWAFPYSSTEGNPMKVMVKIKFQIILLN